jgi:transaldolase
MQIIHQGSRSCPANLTTQVSRLATNLTFDIVTVNTMPDVTLNAFGDHGIVNEAIMFDQSSTEEVIQQFVKAGIDVDALGLELQNEGAKSFVKSWVELMDDISAKGNQLLQAK